MRVFDYSLLKEKTWDSEIISLVAQIHEYKGRQEVYLKQKPETLDKLVEIAKRQSTEASNAIEGIRTTSTRLKNCVRKRQHRKIVMRKKFLGIGTFLIQFMRIMSIFQSEQIIFCSYIVICTNIQKKALVVVSRYHKM